MFKKLMSIALLISALLLTTVTPIFADGTAERTKVIYDQYVDMGGYQFFAHVEGKQKNKPTVVFESGYGQGHEAWRYVQPQVAKYTKTVSYDRAFLGQSDPTTAPRDAIGIATELHALLKEMNVQKPYILVGHSMGGQYIRMFQHLYPDEVAGLVTVDGSVDTIYEDYMLPFWDPELIAAYEELPATTGTFEDLKTSSAQVRAVRSSLLNVPLTVLCAEFQIGPMSPPEDQEIKDMIGAPESDAVWKTLQESLATESQFSKFVYVTDSAHEINLYKPEVITNEIRAMINVVK